MTRGAAPSRPGEPGKLPHAIVLAGGSGDRLRPVTERWLGEHRPKQYCTFVGTRSMLQHTLDRVKTVVPPANIVTVIAQEHERYLAGAVPPPFPGRLVRQPLNRGTAAGVFLPLAAVLERDPAATVMTFPCDHFIYPEGRFLQYVMASYRLARQLANSLLLLGAPATSVETDYGWIEAAPASANSPIAPLRRVERLLEKPSRDVARPLLEQGGLWNTMVVAARASTLWELGRRHLPDLIDAFESVRPVMRAVETGRADANREQAALERIYARLPANDFSADFLARAVDSTLVLPLEDLLWSDWGRPKRVMQSIQDLGLQAPAPLARAL